jgi:hypothetical protein
VLSAVGIVQTMAFVAVLMPLEWMETGHQWLGLGELSKAPAVESVMRQASFIYGMFGIAQLVMARDVVRYRSLLILCAIGYFVYGATFLFTDVSLGMPWLWIAGEGGCSLLIGAILAGLLWADRPAPPQGSDH